MDDGPSCSIAKLHEFGLIHAAALSGGAYCAPQTKGIINKIGCLQQSCSRHRPWSTVFHLAILSCLICLSFSACRPRQTVTLALLGDINLGRSVNPSAGSFAFLASDLAWADLALANLESPLSPDPPAADSAYNLCAPAGRAGLLSAWGFNLLSVANNHDLDCGPDGASTTRSVLEAAGLTPIGPTIEPLYRKVNGLRLAFLAFDDISSPLDMEAAAQAIRSAHESGALVIVSIHWGMEYQAGASDRQKTLAQQFARAGAVLVWGHHPHVLQPAEWIGDKPCEGSRPSQGCTLVLYSLGNALFDQGGLPDTRQSALALVEVGPNGVQSLRLVPFVVDVANSRLAAPDAGTARKILETLKIK